MRRRVGVLAVLLGLAVAVMGTAPQSACGQRIEPRQGAVLCCCRTFNGSCCNYTTFCGGFVPGCICSGHRPAPVE